MHKIFGIKEDREKWNKKYDTLMFMKFFVLASPRPLLPPISNSFLKDTLLSNFKLPKFDIFIRNPKIKLISSKRQRIWYWNI